MSRGASLVASASASDEACLPSPEYVRTHGEHIGLDPDYAFELGPEGFAFVKRLEWNGRVMAVKYGPRVPRSEADVMRMVREQTDVPVPEVYGVKVDEDGVVYIYQELIEGEDFAQAWARLSPGERRALLEHVVAIVRSLSTITPPSGVRLGLVNPASSRPIFDSLRIHRHVFDPVPPPSTAFEFADWMHMRSARLDHHPPDACDNSTMRALARSDAPIQLVHGDVAARNLLVRRGEARVAALLDWESASWLPAWMETYTCAYLSGYLSADRKGDHADVAISEALCGGEEGAKKWRNMRTRFRWR
ncbi:hypothetical protein Rhopal_006120-T1 [Rhodotorula paludigena]|uniref:Aminoglycoside phosphotransferase domain-containing protein n=1 Tax=Rhodotorula paludigena TaxID=86838 RepID=A0AAV5GU94_9BASI|nr:hypothetical protein Rhopal_006120-T1 [Rhodotorula paludigena]